MKSVLDEMTGYGFALIWLIWLGVLYVKYRRMGRDLFVLTLGALSLFVIWLALVTHWIDPNLGQIESFLFTMFVAAIGMGAVLVMWLKTLHKEWAV